MFQWRNKRYILIFCLDNALSLNLSNVWPLKFYTSPKQTKNNSDDDDDDDDDEEDDDDGLKINDTVVVDGQQSQERKRLRECGSSEGIAYVTFRHVTPAKPTRTS